MPISIDVEENIWETCRKSAKKGRKLPRGLFCELSRGCRGVAWTRGGSNEAVLEERPHLVSVGERSYGSQGRACLSRLWISLALRLVDPTGGLVDRYIIVVSIVSFRYARRVRTG